MSQKYFTILEPSLEFLIVQNRDFLSDTDYDEAAANVKDNNDKDNHGTDDYYKDFHEEKTKTKKHLRY